MPLTKLQFRPGINREVTSYTNEGGWYDCDKVRFRYGFPEKIGGWQKLSSTTFLGTCRALHPWVALAGERYLGVGTHLKYYINEGGGYSDITPIRETTAAGAVTFAAAANTLNGNVDALDTEITLSSTTGFPSNGYVQINSEIIFYAGISGMCTEETIQSGKKFADEGAEVLVGNLPGYYPLPEEYMLRYFIELADALPRPLMIYNITATTHMSIPVQIIKKLSAHENIIGLKDSERDVDRLDSLAAFAGETEGFYYQLGWAARSVYALKAGADGIVPSTANAFPELYYKLYQAAVDGDYEKAEIYQSVTDELSAVYQKDKLLSQALPGLKVMLEELGICRSNCISPCYPLKPEENGIIVKNLRKVMERIPR